jgi:hypothetical protein
LGVVFKKNAAAANFSIESQQLPLTIDAALMYLTPLFIYVRTDFSKSSSLKTSHHRDVNAGRGRSERPLKPNVGRVVSRAVSQLAAWIIK